MRQIPLTKLLTNLDATPLCGAAALSQLTVTSLATDSRTVSAGALFIAIQGHRVDGHHYLLEAAERGAVAVVITDGCIGSGLIAELGAKNVVVLAVADSAAILAQIAASYYDYPAKKMRITGITGTNGKTTVAYLVEQVLLQTGRSVGVIGTVNNRYQVADGDPVVLPATLTTPQPVELQRILRQMADAGVEDVIMEVSSHALDQGRIDGLLYDVAAFTNLSRDHLDYHKDMDDYLAAKSLLFTKYLRKDGVAVLPEKREALAAEIDGRVLFWGREERADIQLVNAKFSLEKTELYCCSLGENIHFSTSLLGEYNAENLLAAWGVCLGLGVENSFIGFALSFAHAAPGRLERVSAGGFWPEGQRPTMQVLVDYAHTPDALEKALVCLASLPHRRLCVVFGCGGDRDGGKRPLMGEVAARLADVVIVTDDNPRSEDPAPIRNTIAQAVAAAGCPLVGEEWLRGIKGGNAVGKGCVVVGDRAKAISLAISSMGSEDIVLIAGKGHEAYQITAAGKRFFDDRLEAEKALFAWNREAVVEAVGAAAAGKKNAVENTFGAVSTDSRKPNAGGIFVALKGENHDGHDYAAKAVAAGNRCLVVEKMIDNLPPAVCQIQVKDTLVALGDLAAFRRKRIAAYLLEKKRELRVIGITGSCGKTSTKEMVAAIFACRYPKGEHYGDDVMLKTAGNFNNLIGLPLTLLPLNTEQRVAILEMGMNKAGEIARLTEIARPHIRCITNVHGAHLQGLGSVEGVAAAKGEIFNQLGEEDVVVVNLDDHRVVEQAAQAVGMSNNRQISFSMDEAKGATIFCRNMEAGHQGCYRFLLCSGEKSLPVRLQVAGKHSVGNALCAAAIAFAAGASLEEIACGLAAFRPVDKRMEMVTARSGFTLINDSYNANPGSMEAGLQVLASFTDGKTLAVLGDMLELGAAAEEAHIAIGRRVAELGIDHLAVVGDFAEYVKAGALAAGFSAAAVSLFSNKEELQDWLREKTRAMDSPADAVLVKASRSVALETVVQDLL